MCESLYYNGSINCFYCQVVQIYWFKEKGSEIKAYQLYLGNILKDFTVNKIKKLGQMKTCMIFHTQK